MKNLFALLLWACVTTAVAQNTTAGFMPTINFNKPTGKTNSLNLYVYDIFAGNQGDFINKELYAELVFVQSLGKHFGLSLAYAHQENFINTSFRIAEERLFQEIWRVDAVGNNHFKNRIRVEERFFRFKANDKSDYQTRIRYLFAYRYDLPNKKGFISAYNDLFYAAPAVVKLNENWTYLGYGINFSKKASLELGALWQNYAVDANKRGNQFLFQPTFNLQL